MSNTIAEIVSNAATFGISFIESPVAKGTGPEKVVVGIAPILTVVDFGLFEAAFPGVLLKHSNGQSVRVHAQGITRNMLVADRQAKTEAMKEAQVKGICLGQTVTIQTKTVTVEKIVEVDFSVEKKAALIAKLVDRGMSVADAKEIAESM